MIQGNERWCLLVKDIPVNELENMPHVLERIGKCKEIEVS